MRVIHVTHNGIGAALVRSQVLPYIRELTRLGHEVDLVSFERDDPYPEGEFPRDRWHGLRPLPSRTLSAKVADIVRGIWVVSLLARRRHAHVLHARSYLPAAICWAVGHLLGLPYVFDMRGFMGEEYVDAGIWSRGDLRYRAVRMAERLLLRDAAAIVVLTNVGAHRLRTERRYARATSSRDISVIPCAVDLERFRPSTTLESPPTLVYAGSLGMWYLLDEMLRVYDHARRIEPSLRFLFLNRNQHSVIRTAWSAAALPPELLDIRGVDFGAMPVALAKAHVAIALLRRVPSKVGSSPTKIAEYLACGLPVVVNEGLGDSAEQVRSFDAGHVVTAFDELSLARAGRAVVALLRDPHARVRSRRLAEGVFDLRTGVEAYDALYARIMQRF